MAGSVNKVILIGNLGRDPETRTTQGGQKIVNLTVATSESWKDRATGEKKEQTEWHRLVIFNERLADVADRFLKKGDKVYVEGKLQTRKWTDQSGQERYTTEIVLPKFGGELTIVSSQSRSGGDSPNGENQAQSTPRPENKPKDGQSYGGGWDSPGGDLDDEIPF